MTVSESLHIEDTNSVLREMLTRKIDVQPKLKPLIMLKHNIPDRF